jgi:RNA recognition motif-containing protein
MTRFKCEICNVTLSCEKFWEEHLAGKKHQQQKEKHSQMEAISRRSIYLNNFKHSIDKEEITQIFEQFGEVERIIIDKSGKNGFAIIEFKEEDAAQNILQSIQRLKIGKVFFIKLIQNFNLKYFIIRALFEFNQDEWILSVWKDLKFTMKIRNKLTMKKC